MLTAKKFWTTLAVIAACLLLACVLLLTKDYRRVSKLREFAHGTNIGTPESEILATLGQPDEIFNQSDGSVVWVYCSQFDWDGFRTRWNDQPFITDWMTRLNPSTDAAFDDVIEIGIEHGKIEWIREANEKTFFGGHPALSL